jgi:hypothetical protein
MKATKSLSAQKKIVGQGFILAKFGIRRLQPAQIIVVSRK